MQRATPAPAAPKVMLACSTLRSPTTAALAPNSGAACDALTLTPAVLDPVLEADGVALLLPERVTLAAAECAALLVEVAVAVCRAWRKRNKRVTSRNSGDGALSASGSSEEKL